MFCPFCGSKAGECPAEENESAECVNTSRCPRCGSQEVYVTIHKAAKGLFDDEGCLTTATDQEAIIELTCRGCGRSLPVSMIKRWE